MAQPPWRNAGLLMAGMPAIAAAAVAVPIAAQAPAPLAVEVEAGPIWQTRNVAHAPPDSTGTRFSVGELTGAGPRIAWRTTITVDVDRRHGLRVVFAPLSLAEATALPETIDFGGERFDAGPQTWIRYASSVFRGTYRFRLAASERADVRVGLSAQIRDATVTLEQPGVTRSRNDLGFMPLLHLAADWWPAHSWRVGAEADAVSLGSGRWVDAALRLAYQPGDRWSLGIGYRTIEGGSETRQFHSFAWFHSAVAAIAYRF